MENLSNDQDNFEDENFKKMNTNIKKKSVKKNYFYNYRLFF